MVINDSMESSKYSCVLNYLLWLGPRNKQTRLLSKAVDYTMHEMPRHLSFYGLTQL